VLQESRETYITRIVMAEGFTRTREDYITRSVMEVGVKGG
jgi:hypothetical protein